MAKRGLTGVYTADFETTTDPLDLRVWAWGLYNISEGAFNYGADINAFFNHLKYKVEDNAIVYFHNLKFDGEFLFYWLFENGFTHTQERKVNHKEFSTLITNMGLFFTIRFRWYGKTITILDSLKLIPFKVSQISKAFNLESVKGEIDYHKHRPVGYQADDNEISYLKNDVQIVGDALRFFFESSLDKMTVAGNALNDYKTIFTAKKYKRCYPFLPQDKVLRKSYKGGVVQVKECVKNEDIGEGVVFDVNSLYPSVMYDKPLPYGEPIYHAGEVQYDEFFKLGIQRVSCAFELKENHLPTLQVKKNLLFKATEYLTTSNGENVTLTLTSVDLEMLFEHYDVYNLEYIEGWSFRASTTLFKDYIDKWIAIKNQATREGNEGMRTIAKLMLNSLYGKFGLNPNVQQKLPYYMNGLVQYQLGEKETRDPIYVPIASFITAYARQITITSAQKNYDRFLYMDTDSLHLSGLEFPNNIEIDDVKLGAWKYEGKFKRARYLRAKSYTEEYFITIEEYNALKESKRGGWQLCEARGIYTKLDIKCAGLPDGAKGSITFENFKAGLVVSGKLQQKRLKGGVYLKDCDFTIEG